MRRRLACSTMQNANGREWPATRPYDGSFFTAVRTTGIYCRPVMAYSVRRFFRFLSCTLRSAPSQCQQRGMGRRARRPERMTG